MLSDPDWSFFSYMATGLARLVVNNNAHLEFTLLFLWDLISIFFILLSIYFLWKIKNYLQVISIYSKTISEQLQAIYSIKALKIEQEKSQKRD